jgi:hypothetical protein
MLRWRSLAFPIFTSSKFVEEQRTTDEAQQVGRLIAG